MGKYLSLSNFLLWFVLSHFISDWLLLLLRINYRAEKEERQQDFCFERESRVANLGTSAKILSEVSDEGALYDPVAWILSKVSLRYQPYDGW